MDDPDSRQAALPRHEMNGTGADAGMLEVHIVQRLPLWKCAGDLHADLARFAGKALAASGRELARVYEVSIVLASDEEVRGLNKSYRGKDTPTNVLSFPFEDSFGEEAHLAGEAVPLGDIVLGYETIAREADAMGIDLRHHLYHLTVHGVLHLLGFDHDSDAAAEEMEALETRILLAEGCHDPYSAQDGEGARVAT